MYRGQRALEVVYIQWSSLGNGTTHCLSVVCPLSVVSCFSCLQTSPLPPRLHEDRTTLSSSEDTVDSWASLSSIAAGSLSGPAAESREWGGGYEEGDGSERPQRKGSKKEEKKRNQELG